MNNQGCGKKNYFQFPTEIINHEILATVLQVKSIINNYNSLKYLTTTKRLSDNESLLELHTTSETVIYFVHQSVTFTNQSHCHKLQTLKNKGVGRMSVHKHCLTWAENWVAV